MRSRSTFAICGVVCFLFAVVQLSAQEFEDDFERPDGPASGWTVFSGNWQLVDGTLVTRAVGTESWAWAGDPPVAIAGDIVAELSLLFGPAPGDGVGRHGGLMFYASVPRNRWDGTMSGYTLDWIDRLDDHGLRLIRWDSGTPVTLVNGAPGIPDGAPRDLAHRNRGRLHPGLR
jgi:hypothetical protein